MRLSEYPDEVLLRQRRCGQERIAEAKAQGRAVPAWEAALAGLEAELAHRAEVVQITRLMQSQGWALVWSDVLGEAIAFAQDDASAVQVPGGIIVYTRSELEQIMGKGHPPDMLRLIHEGKKHGGKITSGSSGNG